MDLCDILLLEWVNKKLVGKWLKLIAAYFQNLLDVDLFSRIAGTMLPSESADVRLQTFSHKPGSEKQVVLQKAFIPKSRIIQQIIYNNG